MSTAGLLATLDDEGDLRADVVLEGLVAVGLRRFEYQVFPQVLWESSQQEYFRMLGSEREEEKCGTHTVLPQSEDGCVFT